MSALQKASDLISRNLAKRRDPIEMARRNLESGGIRFKVVEDSLSLVEERHWVHRRQGQKITNCRYCSDEEHPPAESLQQKIERLKNVSGSS